MTLRPGKSCRKAGKKGQPDRSAVTGKTGGLWVTKADLVSAGVTGQNNCNLAPRQLRLLKARSERIAPKPGSDTAQANPSASIEPKAARSGRGASREARSGRMAENGK
jgi:hypothetical protein